MRDRIWTELKQTKFETEYLRSCSLFQDGISKTINILILVFSSSGIFGWSIFKSPEYAGIACSITAGISFIKLILQQFILTEKETKKLDKYYVELVQHYDNVEKFWYDSEYSKIDQSKLTNEFYKLCTKANEIHNRYNDLTPFKIGFVLKKARFNTLSYINQNFHT